MANNDYWAYLKNENELKHGRKAIAEGGSPNGYSSNPNYKPVGQKAKGIRDRFGNYIYDAARNISSKISKRFGDLSDAIRRKQIIDRNSKMEAQRTSYADMGHDKYGWNLKDPRFHSAYGSKGLLAQKSLKEDAEAASQRRKAAIEEEYRNTHRNADARPQDAMKEGQAKARQEADERKLYEDWLAEQEKAKAKKREESLARNQANLDKWGYKDEDYDPNYLGNKAEDLKKLKEKLKESVSKKTIDRSSRPESKPEKKTVAVDANTGRVIPGYNPSLTENTGYRSLGEKWRKNKSRS